MNTWDFTASKLKCKRARKHIEEFHSCVFDWFHSDAFKKLSLNTNQNTGYKGLQFDCTEPIPEDIPIIIGDIVHNLRSALDHIAIEIVRSAGHDIDGLYFPFGGSQVDIINSPAQCKIQLASVAAADIILNSIKPYKTGNSFIWSLNRLSNTDKHRLLIPIISKIEFPWVSLKHYDEISPVKFRYRFTFDGISARSGDIVGVDPSKIEIDGYGDPIITVLFDKRHIAGVPHEQPVAFLLKCCEDLITQYITMFEAI